MSEQYPPASPDYLSTRLLQDHEADETGEDIGDNDLRCPEIEMAEDAE
jgi:hypothetical protein